MDRRGFLALLAASASGCLGEASEGGGGSGNPYFELESIDAPSTAQVGERFPFSITVANTGGRRGRFSTSVAIQGTLAEPFHLSSEIAAGETATMEETLMFRQNARYRYVVEEFGETSTVSAEPARLAMGEAFEAIPRREVRVDEVRFRSDVPDPYVSGEKFAVVKIAGKAHRDGSGDIKAPYGSFYLWANGEQVDSVNAGVDQFTEEGRYDMFSDDVEVGEWVVGWKVYPVSGEVSRSDIEVWFDSMGDGSPEMVWS